MDHLVSNTFPCHSNQCGGCKGGVEASQQPKQAEAKRVHSEVCLYHPEIGEGSSGQRRDDSIEHRRRPLVCQEQGFLSQFSCEKKKKTELFFKARILTLSTHPSKSHCQFN